MALFADFLRCSLLTYGSKYARRSRLEKQPTDLRRNSRDLRDGTLGLPALESVPPAGPDKTASFPSWVGTRPPG
jgi:hypothetical protein